MAVTKEILTLAVETGDALLRNGSPYLPCCAL